jgi:hypothetical protein
MSSSRTPSTTFSYLKAEKCKFEQREVPFLGFLISLSGIKANPEYVSGVTKFPTPTTLKQCQRFIGMASYYRRFIPNFSKVAQPLSKLTGKDVPFLWTSIETKAFEELKSRMSRAPVIAHYDPECKTIVQTDASNQAWGFIISQISKVNNKEHPIAIESGGFKGAKLNYTTTEKEFLAIVMAFRRKRHLLLQVTSTVLTDHLNLTYWMEPRQLSSRQAQWVDLMAKFSFQIVYRPGAQAVFPDALS